LQQQLKQITSLWQPTCKRLDLLTRVVDVIKIHAGVRTSPFTAQGVENQAPMRYNNSACRRSFEQQLELITSMWQPTCKQLDLLTRVADVMEIQAGVRTSLSTTAQGVENLAHMRCNNSACHR